MMLGELARQYLNQLGESLTPEVQQEVLRFARWWGQDRTLADLTPALLESYLAQIPPGPQATARLQALKAFLQHAHKQGHTRANLASHIKVKAPRARTPASAPAGPSLPQVHLTREGYARLQQELEALQRERVRLSEEVRRAAADKDVRENAPLEMARQQLGKVESRIREIEITLRYATVVEEAPPHLERRVRLGSRVTVQDLATGWEQTYTLVDGREAHPGNGRLSASSPVGRALLDREEGEVVEVAVPKGTLRLRILRVE